MVLGNRLSHVQIWTNIFITANGNRLPEMVIDYFKLFFKSQVIIVSDNRLPFMVIDYLKWVLKNRIFWVGNRLL